MAVSEVGGALMKYLGLMCWVSGNSLGGGVKSFPKVLDSRWVTAPKLVFGTTCGVGNVPLRQLFQGCIALPPLGMLPWLIILSSLVALLSGMLILLEWRMIGS
jgi:hypothetical protein